MELLLKIIINILEPHRNLVVNLLTESQESINSCVLW